MPENNLPTYAIVELLIRLANYNSAIGDYKNHVVYTTGIMVKTSRGTIQFPQSLITQQFEAPTLITDDELAEAALLFMPTN